MQQGWAAARSKQTARRRVAAAAQALKKFALAFRLTLESSAGMLLSQNHFAFSIFRSQILLFPEIEQ
jgi:hypothetical protein